MICPKCGRGEINDSGPCPECGFSVASGPAEPDAARQAEGDAAHVGLIPMDYTGPSAEDGTELPAWRQELSRRLHEIKRKRETSDQSPAGSDDLPPLPLPKERPPALPQPAAEEPPRRRPSRPRPVPPVMPGPVQSTPSSTTDVPPQSAQPAPPPAETPPVEPPAEPVVRQEPAATPKQANIQDLIDSIMTKKSAQPDTVPEPEKAPTLGVPDRPGEGKLILLSRTLSGLVDLLIVVLCAGAFILAADFTSGIEVLDDISLFHYAQLLLAIFLLYSIFMLGTANQTMGMMITDLKVVRARGERPSIGRVVARTVAFLLSFLALGTGLIWAVFDRKSLCLHDRISGTEVIRM
jgi:uncharacterized RDD family membrane protein YckC